MGGGRGAICVRSAFGPVGILAGKLFGEACIEAGTPTLRGPKPEFVFEAASCGACGGNGALGNCGDALVRKAACGAIGGGRGLGAGPCGGDLAAADGWEATDGTGGAEGGGGMAEGGGGGGGARMGCDAGVLGSILSVPGALFPTLETEEGGCA
jgi:hypothetical protein